MDFVAIEKETSFLHYKESMLINICS